MNLGEEKQEIIEYILATNDESTLKKVKESLQINSEKESLQRRKKPYTREELIRKFAIGMEDKVGLEKIKREQNYKKLTSEEMDEIIDALDFKETKEEFDKMLDGI